MTHIDTSEIEQGGDPLPDEGKAGSVAPDFDPDEAAENLGLSEQQKNFALARLKGMSQWRAAKHAGYAADKNGEYRKIGSQVNASSKVQRFIALAGSWGKAPEPKTMDWKTRRLRLSEMANGPDRGIAIRAIEQLNKMEAEERERERNRRDGDGDPKSTLDEIAIMGPPFVQFAQMLADEHKLDWSPPEGERLAALKRRYVEPQAEEHA